LYRTDAALMTRRQPRGRSWGVVLGTGAAVVAVVALLLVAVTPVRHVADFGFTLAATAYDPTQGLYDVNHTVAFPSGSAISFDWNASYGPYTVYTIHLQQTSNNASWTGIIPGTGERNGSVSFQAGGNVVFTIVSTEPVVVAVRGSYAWSAGWRG
jgi:hypothetical protein